MCKVFKIVGYLRNHHPTLYIGIGTIKKLGLKLKLQFELFL